MNSLQATAARFDQDAFWHPNLYPMPQNGSLDHAGNYAMALLDIFGAPLPSQSTSHSPQEIKPDLANRATSVNQKPPSVERLPSPKREPLQSTKVPLPPDHPPQIQRKRRKRCSSEALERRRKQNRTAQNAYRSRKRKYMEELHRELSQCVDINQKMQHSMRNLLERTDNLKRDIVAILEVKMPATSLDTWKSERRSSYCGYITNRGYLSFLSSSGRMADPELQGGAYLPVKE